jgi:hypothetical protein
LVRIFNRKRHLQKTFGIVLVVAIAIALLVLAWQRYRYSQEQWRVGGLYSFRDKKEFGILKVLGLDSDAVHVRIYQQKFAVRPATVDPNTLTLGKLGDENFSIGHLPLSRKSFSSWDPVFVSQQTVREEELEGYRIWQRAQGGAFGPTD